MKTKTLFQLFLSVFILAIAAFAFYEYKESQNEKKSKKESEQLLKALKLDKVKAVRLFKEKEKISIIKQGEDWLLLEPLQDRVSFTELSRWFNTIARHKVQALEIENPVDSHYYIGETPRVEIDLNSGETLAFVISSKKTFDERWFIKKSSQIFLAETGIDRELQDKKLEDFRSKKMLPSLNHAIKIQIEKKEILTLNWKDYKWSLEGKKESELPLNQAFLNEFWSFLTNLSARSILESKTEFKKYKLDTPLLTIHLFYEQLEKNQTSKPEGESKQVEEQVKKYVLKISPPQKDKIYASISHRDYIFEIPKDQLKNLLLTREELFDHSFPFNFDSSLVSNMQINNGEQVLNLKKKKDTWILEKDSKPTQKEKEKTLVSYKIEDFFNQIKALKGTGYKKVKEASVLRSIHLKDSKGELLFELKELEQSNTQSWLKSHLWKEWVSLPKKELDELFQLSLFKDNTEEKK